VLTAISDEMVALLKEFYGSGPTRTKSYFADDLVVCVLRGGSRGSRRRCSKASRFRGHSAADGVPGRDASSLRRGHRACDRPAGDRFMSGNQQHPDMMCEVFILARPISSTSTRSRQTGGSRRLADATRRQAKRLRQLPGGVCGRLAVE